MSTARCDGVIVTDVNGVPACEDQVGAPLAWVAVEPFSTQDIDTVAAGQYLAAGFVLYASIWFAGRGARFVLDAIDGRRR
jgi:hypothetical protein